MDEDISLGYVLSELVKLHDRYGNVIIRGDRYALEPLTILTRSGSSASVIIDALSADGIKSEVLFIVKMGGSSVQYSVKWADLHRNVKEFIAIAAKLLVHDVVALYSDMLIRIAKAGKLRVEKVDHHDVYYVASASSPYCKVGEDCIWLLGKELYVGERNPLGSMMKESIVVALGVQTCLM